MIYNCNFHEKQLQTIDSLISNESSIVIKINNVGKFKSDISNNAILKNIATTNLGYNFGKQLDLINNFDDNTSLIICLIDNNNEKVFQIISKDSLNKSQIINNKLIGKDSLNIQEIIHTKLNEFHIYSNSNKINLKNNNGQLTDYDVLKKSFEENTSFSLFTNSKSTRNFLNTIFKNQLFQSQNKLGLNVDIYNKKILLNGVSINSDTVNIKNNIFNNSSAAKSKNYSIIPEKTSQITNYTNINFDDFFKSKDSIKNLELNPI